MTTLMVQGCTSDAGKSALVTALCRWLARQGVNVAPFKPQNMALNSAVTADGGEIGRAQAVQAHLPGLQVSDAPSPEVLKPGAYAHVLLMGLDLPDSTAAQEEADTRLRAQLAACHIAEKQFGRLVAKYGPAQTKAFMREAIDYAERLAALRVGS